MPGHIKDSMLIMPGHIKDSILIMPGHFNVIMKFALFITVSFYKLNVIWRLDQYTGTMLLIATRSSCHNEISLDHHSHVIN